MSFLDDYRAALEPAIGAEAADKAIRILEKGWLGSRPYISKRETKAARIRELSKRLPVKVIAARVGCSRQHVYAIIRRPKP